MFPINLISYKRRLIKLSRFYYFQRSSYFNEEKYINETLPLLEKLKYVQSVMKTMNI